MPFLSAIPNNEFGDIYNGHFALQVEGDQFRSLGFLEGDILIIERRDVAYRGEIAVCRKPFDSESELWLFRITLPQTPKQAQVKGVVSSMIRKYNVREGM